MRAFLTHMTSISFLYPAGMQTIFGDMTEGSTVIKTNELLAIELGDPSVVLSM